MKRLLCIVGSMNAGGAETFLMKIYRQLDKSQYQMDFAVAVKEKGYYDDEIRSLGGKIFHITPKSEGAYKNFESIKKIVKKNQYRFVLRTSQHSLSALELLAAKLGGATVRVFRSSNSNTTNGSKTQMILHKVCMFMPKVFANVRIAPSSEAAEFMFGKKSIIKRKAKILQNGIDLNYFKYDVVGRKTIRNEFHIENQFVVGHIGRFNQQKNHQFLLDVFKEIKSQRSDAILLLVGKGELEEEIKQKIVKLQIEDSVIFTGVRSDIPQILSAMDVFVFPSLYEGMPNTIIEAQATGLPCVISNTITEEADITGLVEYFPLDQSPREWSKVAIAVSENPRMDMHEQIKAKGYDIESVVRIFIELIFQVDNE